MRNSFRGVRAHLILVCACASHGHLSSVCACAPSFDMHMRNLFRYAHAHLIFGCRCASHFGGACEVVASTNSSKFFFERILAVCRKGACLLLCLPNISKVCSSLVLVKLVSDVTVANSKSCKKVTPKMN